MSHKQPSGCFFIFGKKMNYSFSPSATRANKLDCEMRKNLASSLSYIVAELDGNLNFDKPSLDKLIAELKQGAKYSALLFALYTDLVFALTEQSNENIDDLIAEMIKLQPLDSDLPQAVVLEDRVFNYQGQRLANIMNLEEGVDFLIQSPLINKVIDYKQQINAAMQLMQQAMPELSEEIRQLITQIIMVEPAKDSELEFAGGSSYMMWGGLFLNVGYHSSIAQLIEGLAHESAHMLLFGYAAEGRLTLNDEDARYQSPLRYDARPMEGIYHATFVTARMFWAMQNMAESDVFSPQDRDYAKQAMLNNIESFKDGYAVLEKHAELSEVGERVMQDCFKYMQPFLN